MIDRTLFTPQHDDPPHPVPIDDLCTVPTSEMAYLLADALNTNGDVLEIGSGSGFQCAVLAERCRSVVSIECRLHEIAHKLPNHVALIVGNGYEYDTGEEFDGVLVTFATSAISPVWATQVKDGGRLVVPLQIGTTCRISVYERHGDELHLMEAIGYAPFAEGVQA